jgi:hypothetical protein
MPTDPLLTHAREFTDIEVTGLTMWNLLQDIGQADLAQRLLDAVLEAEHYTSLLPHLAADRSPEQLSALAFLRQRMNDLLQQGQAALDAAKGST